MKRVIALSIVSTYALFALGTDAGVEIKNTATLSYSAGGVAQPDVTSNEDSFLVDKKIDLIFTTTDNDQVEVTPGQEDRITEYEFTNEGNSNQNFKFEVKNLPNDAEADYDTDKDNEDVKDMIIEYDDGSGSWQELPSDGILEIDEDATYKFRVKADIKTADEGAEDKDIMNIEISATAYKDDESGPEEETTGEDTQDQVDVVFADGESVQNGASSGLGKTESDDTGHKGDTPGDGKDVARSGYIIQTPVLSVTKTSCVLSDPVNGEDKPKRIPGAIIRYMFDINNTGTADVEDLNLTDTFNDNLDLSRTKDSAKKSESQDDECVCSSEPSTDISDDTTISGQDMKIENIDVAAGSTQDSDGEKHTCVSVEVEVK